MRNWEDMVEYYRDHPDERDAILKHAGLLRKEEPMTDDRQKNPDEIVLTDVKVFHLKNTNNQQLFVGCYTLDNKIYHLNISAKGNKLVYYWSDETPDEPTTEPPEAL